MQGYGYQMWRCRPGCFRADGARGQYIIVVPARLFHNCPTISCIQYQNIVVITSPTTTMHWPMQKPALGSPEKYYKKTSFKHVTFSFFTYIIIEKVLFLQRIRNVWNRIRL